MAMPGKMTLFSLFSNVGKDRTPTVNLVRERCLRRRLNSCECRRCLDVCASGALSLVDRQLQLDPEKCTDCMACTAVCVSEALAADPDVQTVLPAVLAQVAEELVISCTRQKQLSADEIAVPCLGIFAEESLLALGMSGCPSIVFRRAGCSTCPNSRASMLFLAALKRVRDKAGEILPTKLLTRDDVEDGESAVVDRRAFLVGLRCNLAAIAKVGPEFATTVSQAKTSARRIPIKVKLLGEVMAKATAENREQLLLLVTHTLTADPACNRCPLCTGICPTGALRLSGSGIDKQLLFTGSLCSGCGLCVSFCKQTALSLFRSPLLANEQSR